MAILDEICAKVRALTKREVLSYLALLGAVVLMALAVYKGYLTPAEAVDLLIQTAITIGSLVLGTLWCIKGGL